MKTGKPLFIRLVKNIEKQTGSKPVFILNVRECENIGTATGVFYLSCEIVHGSHINTPPRWLCFDSVEIYAFSHNDESHLIVIRPVDGMNAHDELKALLELRSFIHFNVSTAQETMRRKKEKLDAEKKYVTTCLTEMSFMYLHSTNS